MNNTENIYCTEPAPYFWFSVSMSLIGLTTSLLASLAVFTTLLARRKKRLLETPKRTWVMNLDLITGGTANIYDKYEVFMDKTESEFKHFKDKSSRSKSLVPLSEPSEDKTRQFRSRSNMETARARLVRSDSDEEANFMLKVLNYPQIYYENLPPPKARRESVVDQFKRRLGSISASSTESSIPPTPPPPPQKPRQASVQFQEPQRTFVPKRVRQLRAASYSDAIEVQRNQSFQTPSILKLSQHNTEIRGGVSEDL